jgi:L-lysine exporter family protein LysE/ArgO
LDESDSNRYFETMTQYLQGFGIGLGLLVAIGAQNAFVISRAVRKDRAVLVAAICMVCDAILIALAVTGAGAALAMNPAVAQIATIGGIVFLVCFGARAFRASLRERTLDHRDARRVASLRSTVLATLAVTLLNPHTFLDTFVLIAGISAPLDASGRAVFGAGAVTASFVWFSSLAVAGRALAPWFRQPRTWKLLDGFVCATMWTIAAVLAVGLLA